MKILKSLFLIALSISLVPGIVEAKEKKLKTGEIYKGDWKKGKPNGKGIMVYPNGDIFEGIWVDGVPKGEGTKIFGPTKEWAFIGNWNDDKTDGQPGYIYSDKETYVGTGVLKGPRIDGIGDFIPISGEFKTTDFTFSGEFKDGVPHKGTVLFSDGSKIEGEFESNDKWPNITQKSLKVQNGRGKVNLNDNKYTNGTALYDGEWSNGNFVGTISGKNYSTIINDFIVEIDKNGNQRGTLKTGSGATYTGEIKDKKFNGEGTFSASTRNLNGIWKNGYLWDGNMEEIINNQPYRFQIVNGRITYIDPNGNVYPVEGFADGSSKFLEIQKLTENKKKEEEFHKRWSGNFVKFSGKLVENPEEDAKFRAFFGLDSSYFQGLAEITLSADGIAHFMVGVAPTQKAFNQTRQKALQVSMFCEEMNRDVTGKWTIEGNKLLIDGKKYGLTISSDNKSIYYSGTLDAKMILQQ